MSKSQSVSRCLVRCDCVLLQFTGVCDGKGVMIFEGDILYYRHYDDRENKVYESWHEVVFQKGAFGSMLSANDFQSFGEQTDDGQIDELLVGNVFENRVMLDTCRAELASKLAGPNLG